MENVQKCVFRASLSRKMFKFSQQPYFFKRCEFCAEAIEMPGANTFSEGHAPKTTGFFTVICILQFRLILEYFSTFSLPAIGGHGENFPYTSSIFSVYVVVENVWTPLSASFSRLLQR